VLGLKKNESANFMILLASKYMFAKRNCIQNKQRCKIFNDVDVRNWSFLELKSLQCVVITFFYQKFCM
jgi:hypothetical protein